MSFIKKTQERVFPFIIAISALSVSASAAFYSVSGLSKLFAGAAFAVTVMAASLEISKLVIASLLYQYRKTLPRGLKVYLTSAAAVLVLITSMGIYGFLSAAYQQTAAKDGLADAEISILESREESFKSELLLFQNEKESLSETIAELSKGLSNNKIQYRDRETGEIITTTSSSTRRALERQLDNATDRRKEVNERVDELNQSLFSVKEEIVSVKASSEGASELGPLKFLSGLTGIPMDSIINYLLLTIIFVFDPLAIALVIAANFAFERLVPNRVETIYGEKEVVEDDGMWTEEEVEDFNDQFNADHLIPEEDRVEEVIVEPVVEKPIVEEVKVDIPKPTSPGLYHDGRLIIKTPDKTGSKWSVVYEDEPSKAYRVMKSDIVRIEDENKIVY